MLQIVVSLEGLNELHQDLLLALFALENIGMAPRVVEVLDVVDLKKTIAVSIDLVKSSLNELPSIVVELSPDGHKELINVQSAVVVGIKDIKNERHVLLIDADFEVLAHLGELVLRNALRAVVIHDGEELLKAHNAASAPGLDLVPEQVDELLWVRRSIRGSH
jgi:hypothetical protein